MADFEKELKEALPRGVRGDLNAPTGAEWAVADDLGPEWQYRRKGVLLGSRRVRGQPMGVGWQDDRHVVTVAGSRAGKGVSLMVPNLLLYEGSVLAIDPKGELARTTSRIRAAKPDDGGLGQRVYVLDPFGASLKEAGSAAQREALRQRFAAFNPLAELDPDSPDVIDDAAIIADALIVPSEYEPHWGERAKEILQALILMVLILPEAKRNLAVVRDMLALRDGSVLYTAEKETVSPLRALFKMMQTLGDRFEGVVASTGTTFLDLGGNELASILSTAQAQTRFLDSPGLRRVITRSDFRLADLKREKATLYLCLPAGRMGTHANWLRVIINLALNTFENTDAKPDTPVLMLLEEFPVLGHMRSIEVAAGQLAGFGVKLWTVLQDLTQIKRHYRESWETFIGNAGVLTFFGNTDATTLDYISRKLGNVTMDLERASGASSSALLSGAKALQEDMRESPLLAPHEVEQVFARENDRLLVLAAGRTPLIVERWHYYKDEPFVGKWDP